MEVRNNQQDRTLPNQIIQGDCTRVMKDLPEGIVDFIVTDPPYGVGVNRSVGYTSRDGRNYPGDTDFSWLQPAMNQMYRVLKDNSWCVCFTGWLHDDEFVAAAKRAGFSKVGEMVFVKDYASSTKGVVDYYHETAVIFAKGHPRRPAYRIGNLTEGLTLFELKGGNLCIFRHQLDSEYS